MALSKIRFRVAQIIDFKIIITAQYEEAVDPSVKIKTLTITIS